MLDGIELALNHGFFTKNFFSLEKQTKILSTLKRVLPPLFSMFSASAWV
jgi:hypothetical protein